MYSKIDCTLVNTNHMPRNQYDIQRTKIVLNERLNYT